MLLICLAVGIGLWYAIILTPIEEPAKPEFNIFDLEAGGSLVKFNLQNLGEADAHNVTITVNGTWIPQVQMNITSVENGYSPSVSTYKATIFKGTFNVAISHDVERLITKVISSVGFIESDYEAGWFAVGIVEEVVNQTLVSTRWFTDSEIALVEEILENPHPYYTSAEKTIDILRKDEIKTVDIHLEWSCDSFEMVISCDEGVTLEETM